MHPSMSTISYISPELLPNNASRDPMKKVSSTFRITGIAPQPVEQWNTPIRHRRPYRHRQQDSFQANVETRTDEDVGEDYAYQYNSSRSRCTALEESRVVPPMESTIFFESSASKEVVPLSMRESLLEEYHVAPPFTESSAVLRLDEEPKVVPSTIESMIQSLVDSGCHHYELGDYDHAESDFHEALQVCHHSSRRRVAAILYENLGATYLQLGNFHQAKLYLQKCWRWKQKQKGSSSDNNVVVVVEESSSMTDLFLNLGNLVACENWKESVYWYQLALENLKRNAATSDIQHQRDNKAIDALFNLGRVHTQHQHWEQAQGYLEQTYAAVRTKHPVHGDEHHSIMAETLDLLGLVHMARGNYDPAMSAFTNAMAILRPCLQNSRPMHHRRHHHRSMAQSMHHLGLLREVQGEWSDAWETYTLAHEWLMRTSQEEDCLLLQMICQSIHTIEVQMARRMQCRQVV